MFKGNQYRVQSKEFLFLALNNQLEFNRLGLVIGKKSLKLATDRNLIKRLIRETFRTKFSTRYLANQQQGFDMIVLSKPAIIPDNKKALMNTLDSLFDDLIRKTNGEMQHV